MGLELIVLGVGVVLSAAASTYSIIQGRKGQGDKMAPTSMDSFGMTRVQEGLAVPLVYGRVRIPGNIVWWGDLITKPIKAKGGGKGMGGKGGVQGYKYYVSCWQVISMGQISLVKTYVNDKEAVIESADTIWNDGTLSVYPTNVPKSNKLTGIAHIFYDGWYLGDNVQNIPNLHFVVDRVLPTTIPNANLATGSNPAAVIYDLLLQGGVQASEIDLDAFKAAADGWEGLGLGLNLVFSEQTSASEAIENVLKFVDAVVYVNGEGKYSLKGFFGIDLPGFSLDEDDIKDFSLNRKTWGQIPNDFSATFLDESLDFSQRVVRFQNTAAIRAALTNINQSLDLKCFRDLTTASQRLFAVMLESSYPTAEIKFKTNLKFSTLLPGDVIRLSYASLGIANADFRITTVDNTTLDKNEVGISAVEKTDGLFDIGEAAGGGSGWEKPNYSPVVLTHVAVFELPFNFTTLEEPAYLLLAAREKLVETGFAILQSNSESGDYTVQGVFDSYSQYGTLDETYPANTHEIDDTIGILYTPYEFDPEFVTQSRADLFSGNRVLVIGNELLGFEKVIPEGVSSYRLLGIVRGVLNTPVEEHLDGSDVWLAEISPENVLAVNHTSLFWLKFIPIVGEIALDVSLVNSISVTYSGKAVTPPTPSARATRSSDSVAFEIFPGLKNRTGAGTQPEDVYLPPGPAPYEFEGDFEVDDGTISYQTSTQFTLTFSGQATIAIRHRINGRFSNYKSIVVGSEDATYYA